MASPPPPIVGRRPGSSHLCMRAIAILWALCFVAATIKVYNLQVATDRVATRATRARGASAEKASPPAASPQRGITWETHARLAGGHTRLADLLQLGRTIPLNGTNALPPYVIADPGGSDRVHAVLASEGVTGDDNATARPIAWRRHEAPSSVCSVAFFHHLPKTAGTLMRSLILRNAGADSNAFPATQDDDGDDGNDDGGGLITAPIPFEYYYVNIRDGESLGDVPAWMALANALFASSELRASERRHPRIVVEVEYGGATPGSGDKQQPQGDAEMRLLPFVRQLRQWHESAGTGCVITLATILREPRDAMLSYFGYFVPHADPPMPSSASPPPPLATHPYSLCGWAVPPDYLCRWIAGQGWDSAATGAFADDGKEPCAPQMRAGDSNEGGDALATALLSEYDVVGTTDALDAFILLFADRVGFPYLLPAPDLATNPGRFLQFARKYHEDVRPMFEDRFDRDNRDLVQSFDEWSKLVLLASRRNETDRLRACAAESPNVNATARAWLRALRVEALRGTATNPACQPSALAERLESHIDEAIFAVARWRVRQDVAVASLRMEHAAVFGPDEAVVAIGHPPSVDFATRLSLLNRTLAEATDRAVSDRAVSWLAQSIKSLPGQATGGSACVHCVPWGSRRRDFPLRLDGIRRRGDDASSTSLVLEGAGQGMEVSGAWFNVFFDDASAHIDATAMLEQHHEHVLLPQTVRLWFAVRRYAFSGPLADQALLTKLFRGAYRRRRRFCAHRECFVPCFVTCQVYPSVVPGSFVGVCPGAPCGSGSDEKHVIALDGVEHGRQQPWTTANALARVKPPFRTRYAALIEGALTASSEETGWLNLDNVR